LTKGELDYYKDCSAETTPTFAKESGHSLTHLWTVWFSFFWRSARPGTIYYLRTHTKAVEAWRGGRPRRSQPSFDDLLSEMHPAAPADLQDAFRTVLHKLVHSDPAASIYNMFDRHEGLPVFSCGKVVDQREACNLVSIAGRVAIAVQIFAAAAK
jgi:hypothetical protein